MKFKLRIKKTKALEETSVVAGGGMHGYPVSNKPPEDDEMNEMYSSAALTGRNYRVDVSGEEEHAGHVERSRHQGLKNVVESEKIGTYRIKVLTKPQK